MNQEQINKYTKLIADFIGIDYIKPDPAAILGIDKQFACVINFPDYTNYDNCKPINSASPGINEIKNKRWELLLPAWFKFKNLDGMPEPSYTQHISAVERWIVKGDVDNSFFTLGNAIEWFNTVEK